MTVLESIVRDLRELPPPKLLEVARYVDGPNPKRQERPRAALLETAGCMAGEEGEDFERAVKAESDRWRLLVKAYRGCEWTVRKRRKTSNAER